MAEYNECANRLTYHAAHFGRDQDNVSGHMAVGKSLGYRSALIFGALQAGPSSLESGMAGSNPAP